MRGKLKFRIPVRYIVFVVTIICIALAAITYLKPQWASPVRDAVVSVMMPMQKGLNKVGNSVSGTVTDFIEMWDAQQRVKVLEDQLASIEQENSQLQQYRYDNSRYEELLELQNEYSNYETTAANVVSGTGSNWYYGFHIDKGSEDGIFLGANVVAKGGLVGRVVYVAPHYSRVMSIMDDTSNVSGMSQNGDICNISGDSELYDQRLLKINYTSKDADINVGDKILTSNISSSYHQDLLIGYVESIELDSDQLTKSGYLTPAVSDSNLQEVLIITTPLLNTEEESSTAGTEENTDNSDETTADTSEESTTAP